MQSTQQATVSSPLRLVDGPESQTPARISRWTVLAAAIVLMLSGCAAGPATTNSPDAAPGAAATDPAGATNRDVKQLDLDVVIQRDDRILFIGDDITQQMFYTRGVASALMAVRPRYRLEFTNGGKDGARATDGGAWIDELMVLAKPTVVFICLGFNDGQGQPVSDELKESYHKGLVEYINRAKGYSHVRRVVLLGPPATHHGVADRHEILGENIRLKALSDVAYDAANEKQVDYIELFDYMLSVYVAAAKLNSAPLVSAFELPTEPAHILMASAVLYGIGVTPEMMDPVGWSPLIPRKMGTVRQALAVGRKPVLDLNKAQDSRTLYEQMRRFDEVFFRMWRLAKPDATDPQRNREELTVEAKRLWVEIQAMSIQMYGHLQPVENAPAAAPTP